MTTHPDYHQSPFAVSVPRAQPPGLLARFAYGTLKTLTVLAALSGVGFSLYRNDILLEGATHLGLQAPYLDIERRLVGAPGWGTPRTTPALSAGVLAATSHVPRQAGVAREPAAERALARSVRRPAPTAAARGERDSSTGARATADGVTIVSVDALPLLKAEPATQQVSAPALPRKAERIAPARRAVRAEASPARANQTPVHTARHTSAPPMAAPKSRAAAPQQAPAAAAPTNDNPLKAAIRSAVQKETAVP